MAELRHMASFIKRARATPNATLEKREQSKLRELDGPSSYGATGIGGIWSRVRCTAFATCYPTGGAA